MKNKKSVLLGFVLGYLVTSYFGLGFPGFWFWFFVLMMCSVSGGLYLLWRRINQDIVDY